MPAEPPIAEQGEEAASVPGGRRKSAEPVMNLRAECRLVDRRGRAVRLRHRGGAPTLSLHSSSPGGVGAGQGTGRTGQGGPGLWEASRGCENGWEPCPLSQPFSLTKQCHGARSLLLLGQQGQQSPLTLGRGGASAPWDARTDPVLLGRAKVNPQPQTRVSSQPGSLSRPH